MLDAGWENLSQGTNLPYACWEQAELAAPRPEEIVDGATAVANVIANYFFDVMNAFKEARTDYPHHLASGCLGLIETLIDSLGETQVSSIAQGVASLFQREIDHQNCDLDTLSSDSSPTAIETVRAKSAGNSVYGNFWFSE
jgi:hypothetical protein